MEATQEFTVFRNTEKVELNKVLEKFKSSLEKSTEVYSTSEIELLVNLYAKNPVDKFIVSNFPKVEIAQGDILIWAEGTEMYEENAWKLRNLKPTNKLVLQPNDSITGDHRIVPLKDSEINIQEGYFIPKMLKNVPADMENRKRIRGLLVELSKPFLIVHREHGNIALPAGKYMICSQLDPRFLTIILD